MKFRQSKQYLTKSKVKIFVKTVQNNIGNNQREKRKKNTPKIQRENRCKYKHIWSEFRYVHRNGKQIPFTHILSIQWVFDANQNACQFLLTTISATNDNFSWRFTFYANRFSILHHDLTCASVSLSLSHHTFILL